MTTKKVTPAVSAKASYGLFKLSLKIYDRRLAAATTFGIGVGIAAFCYSNRQLVTDTVKNALEAEGRRVENVQPHSIVVELHCDTIESFLLFMDDFKSKNLERRLNMEFRKIGYNEELEVTINNIAEANMHLEQLRGERATPSKVKEEPGSGGVSSKEAGQLAIPLCLPNNWRWDSNTSQCVRTGEKRHSLYVVNEALEKLRRIKGPVCVVSIAGPYRKGKSYILSEAFDQPNVFPLGHHMDPETVGIWLWIVPGIFQDSMGQNFTVVLLDSEGIDSVSGEGHDDNQIFTLTVLLASVLIFNSGGVPTRWDLEGLEYIAMLSQRIEVRTKTKNVAGRTHRDSEFFHKTFPFFIWLLRDVVQEIPPDCQNIKDYLFKKVFKVHDSSAASKGDHKVAESILRFFSGFEAFTLPVPTVYPELLSSVNDNKLQLNPLFLRGCEEFKRLLGNILTPKKSFNEGELVTGEGLAALVQLYVKEINSPGVIPNVQNAWETFVEMKSFEAIRGAVEIYEDDMRSTLEGKLPCDNDELRKVHGTVSEKGQSYFMKETAGISTNTTEKYLNKLKELLSENLNTWKTKNGTLTREYCNDLLIQLKQNHLEPVLRRLQGKEAAKISFDEVIGGYNRIKEDYHNSVMGAKDVIAAVFFEFYPALLLRQLKDYDEELAQELAHKAYQEQERQRLENEQERLRQENLAVKKEMEMLCRKQEEERKRFRQQMEYEFRAQSEQMNNMLEANMKQARKEREEFMQKNEDLKKQLLEIQEANEGNIKMIKQRSDLLARQEEEKRRLHEQLEREQAAREREELKVKREQKQREKQEKLSELVAKEMEEKLRVDELVKREQAARKYAEQIAKMEREHKEEQNKLRNEMEAKMQRQREILTREFQEAVAAARVERMDEMQEQLDRVNKELEKVKKPNVFQRGWSKAKAVGRRVKEQFSPM